MVTEHKLSVPLFHADLELADAAVAVDATRTSDQKNVNSIKSLDRKDIVSTMMTASTTLDGRGRRPTIDIYFAIIETCSSGCGSDEEEYIASISDPKMCPRKRAIAYLMRGCGGSSNDDSGGGDSISSSSIDASRMMLYLQGGPGFGCAAPSVGLGLASSSSSWAAKALTGGGVTNTDGKTFERIVLMDQRGTGRSSPISKRRLEVLFPDLFLLDNTDGEGGGEEKEGTRTRVAKAVADATEYLAKFRADSIVRDAEWIKEALIRRPTQPKQQQQQQHPKQGVRRKWRHHHHHNRGEQP